MWPDYLTFRPLQSWPGALTPEDERRRAPFSAGLSATVAGLKHELVSLNTVFGTDVLQLALTGDDLRLDGKPRAGAKVAHPGVVLSFSTRATSEEFLSRDHARSYLILKAGSDFGDDKALYRAAARATHPDAGGREDTFMLVQEAWRLLSAEDAYQFAVDTFTSWEDNLRAIVLGMEALRKVARYGIVKGNEQYTGWRQLTAKAVT